MNANFAAEVYRRRRSHTGRGPGRPPLHEPAPRPVEDIRGKEDPKSLYLATRRFCLRRGIPASDPEYASAINWAVFKAMSTFKPKEGRKLINWCIHIALHECIRVHDLHRRWYSDDLKSIDRGLGLPPTTPPIPLTDFEFLSFVACHGKTRAAKLLGMNFLRVDLVLSEIALRIREGVASADSPPSYLLGDPRSATRLSYLQEEEH